MMVLGGLNCHKLDHCRCGRLRLMLLTFWVGGDRIGVCRMGRQVCDCAGVCDMCVMRKCV